MRQAALFLLKHIDTDHQVWLVLGWEIHTDDQPWKMSVCADLTSACWVPCKFTQNPGPFPVYVMDFHFQQKKKRKRKIMQHQHFLIPCMCILSLTYGLELKFVPSKNLPTFIYSFKELLLMVTVIQLITGSHCIYWSHCIVYRYIDI